MAAQPFILLFPDSSEPADDWVRIGLESHNATKYIDAERQFRQALVLDPQHIVALNNIAVTYACGGDLGEAALAGYKASLLTPPSDVRSIGAIHANLALILTEARRHDEAVVAAEKAIVCDEPAVKVAIALTYAGAGRAHEAIYWYTQVLEKKPDYFPCAQNICFSRTLTFDGPEEVCKQQRSYHDHHKQAGFDVPHHTLSLNGRPLRVGYVSGDFKRHSAAFIFGAVIFGHTPAVEPYLYETLKVDPEKDSYTKRFMDLVKPKDRWRELEGKTDEEADAIIRKDRIDILVDLAGHTGGCRIPLFTRKPAPVQVTAWGFAHGSGCPEIDYFFADPVAIPEAERKHYSEKVVDLPCIATFLPPSEYGLKASSLPPVQRDGTFTFGCYCRFEKLNDRYLAAVREILLLVQNSRMIFKDDAFRRPYCVKRVLDALTGIGAKRILFIGGTSHPDHLLSYQKSDLLLDPFPHSGGVVALEQLYMGVPLITLYGTQASGRTAASVLTRMGRMSWIAMSEADYITIAVSLSSPDRRGSIAEPRKTLRDELMESPVIKGYVTAVENLYHRIVTEKAEVLSHG